MKERLAEIVGEIVNQADKADYIIGEVHAYLMRNTPRDKGGIEFFDWFMRWYRNYQKGDGN